jgi:hypothetical protein
LRLRRVGLRRFEGIAATNFVEVATVKGKNNQCGSNILREVCQSYSFYFYGRTLATNIFMAVADARSSEAGLALGAEFLKNQRHMTNLGGGAYPIGLRTITNMFGRV